MKIEITELKNGGDAPGSIVASTGRSLGLAPSWYWYGPERRTRYETMEFR